MQLVDKTERELLEQEELVEGKISIGCGEIAAVQVLSEIIDTFRKKYPRVSFDIFTATADVVKEQMDKGLLDVGLLLEPIDMEKYVPIMSDFHEILMNQPEDEAKDIALSLELFVNGSLNIFNYQTNVDVDNRFTVYGIRDMGTEHLSQCL